MLLIFMVPGVNIVGAKVPIPCILPLPLKLHPSSSMVTTQPKGDHSQKDIFACLQNRWKLIVLVCRKDIYAQVLAFTLLNEKHAQI